MTQKSNPYIVNTCNGQMVITFQHIVEKGKLHIRGNNKQKTKLISRTIENTNFVSLSIRELSGDYQLSIEADGNVIQKQIHL